MVTEEELAGMIDHTNLKAFADDAAFQKLCDEAMKYQFKMVAINPAQIIRCKEKLRGSQVHVGSGCRIPAGDRRRWNVKYSRRRTPLSGAPMRSIM